MRKNRRNLPIFAFPKTKHVENPIAMKRSITFFAIFVVCCMTAVYAQDSCRFLGTNDSLWSDAGNWENGLKPNNAQVTAYLLSSVVVDEDATVSDLVYDASEVSVTVASGCKLTVNGLITPFEEQSLSQYLIVEDSAQLLYGHSVPATVRRKVSPFYNAKETAAWHFIASPLVGQLHPTDLDSLIPEGDNFELMRFNQSHVGEEWERYKDEAYQGSFVLENGQGYLYANGSEVTVSFVGEMLPNDQSVAVDLEYNNASNVAAKGINLVGNPFTCNAYSDRSYYKMNAEGKDFELVRASANEPIASCTGAMVQATAAGQSVNFSRDPWYTDMGCIRMTLKSNGKVIDELIVSFNEGDEIGKFFFTEHTAYLYIQQSGLHCAIATAETSCATPIYFKTTENGSFTVTVTPENVNLNSLYLVDHISGADINLLSTPSYSFSATTSDYLSRFKLFVNTDHGVGEASEKASFAYYANGSVVLQGIENEAVLEVVDLMGRVVKTQRVTPSENTIDIPTACVYLLRLNDGKVMRTQKLVVW